MAASVSDIRGTIDQISLEIMSVSPGDQRGMGVVLNGLDEVAAACGEADPLSAALAGFLARAVRHVILGEGGDAADPTDTVARGIELLQRLEMDPDQGNRKVVARAELLDEIARLAGIDIPPELRAHTVQVACAPAAEGPGEEARARQAQAFEVSSDTPGRPVSLGPLADEELVQGFISEAEEHLQGAENALLSLEKDPQNAELLNSAFRAFHSIKGAAGFLGLDTVGRVAHGLEDMLDSARAGNLALSAPVLDMGFEAIDVLKALIPGIGDPGFDEQDLQLDVPGLLGKAAGVVQSADGNGGGAGLQAPTEAASEGKARSDSGDGNGREPDTGGDKYFVRVGASKLDELVNLVGELAIAQTQVAQSPDVLSTANDKLTRDLSQVMKISKDIQEMVMAMRMVPVRSTFDRMARIVRDLARRSGKQVVYQTFGEDTELDKNMVEELVDPLTHLVRNAVDHGIEPVSERRAAGKPTEGTLTLEAHHRGGSVVIELRDDGKGLDRQKILERAVENGLADPDADYADSQIYRFIFRPGFSTSDQVSEVSGRGVGLDVVQRTVEGLKGTVDVRSQPGLGTSFILQLPLTLAIIDGMVIAVGDQRYILPLTSMVRSLRPPRDAVSTVMGRGEMVTVQGEVLPLLRLHRRFGVAPRYLDPCEGLVVVVESEGTRCGMLVDDLLEMQQVVIKGLNDDLRRDPGLSGCAILGNGRVGLILDAGGLLHDTRQRSQ